MLGTVDKVTVSKITLQLNGAGGKENIKERCDQIKAQIVAIINQTTIETEKRSLSRQVVYCSPA